MGSVCATERFIALSERLSCFTALAEPVVLPQDRSPHDLKGASLGIKDLFDVPGFITTCGGKRAFAEPPSRPAVAIQRLLGAGMLAAGKTEMVELAVGGWGTNRARGTPWNPWDTAVHRVPGGSSSGSAVAVAAGLVNAAVGSDTGGSVRIPAALCGIVGLKPGWGQISQSGMAPLSPILDVIGPMAGDVETVAAMYMAMLDSPVVVKRTQQQMACWQPAGDAPLENLRIAIPAADELAATSPAVRSGFESALSRLGDLGASLGQIVLEHSFSTFAEPTAHIFLSDGLRLYRDWLSRYEAEMDPWVVHRLRSAEGMSTDIYQQHVAARESVRQRFCKHWEDAELLVLPTTPISAIPVAEVNEAASTLALYTRPFNYMDLPALAVPMGFDDAGLPLSLQLVGRPGSEGTLLGVGRAFMAADRNHRLPPLHFESVPTP